MSKEELKIVSQSIPSAQVQSNLTILEFLVSSKIASSNREARELLADKAITIQDKNDFIESDLIDVKYYAYDNVVIVKKEKENILV
nr:hypothetical protein [Spiroplasma clarkii]